MDGKASDWRPGPTVCRCCLTEGCYKDISTEYFWMGKREVYAEMLSETLNLSIAFSQSGGPNSNSRLICEPCIARLRDATEFKRQVIDCEKTFMHHLDPGSASTSKDATVSTIGEVKIELVKREKQSLSDDEFDDRADFLDVDDDDDDLDDQPLTKLATKIPKKEAVDLLDLLDNSQITVKRKSTIKLKETPKKIKKKEVVTSLSKAGKASASKAVTKKPVAEKKKAGIDPTRSNAETLLRWTTAFPFRVNDKSILCVYCHELYEDPSAFRDHMRADHGSSALQVVFYNLPKSEFVKADLTDLACKICSERFNDLEAAASHLSGQHNKRINSSEKLGVMPYKLKKDSFNCAVCGKTVASLLHLNRHTISHFLSFVCHVCGSSYIASTGLLRHLRLKHQDYAVDCKRCRIKFPNMEAKERHKRAVKSCMPYSCPQCAERFPDWKARQKHMEVNHGVSKRTYRCAECNVDYTSEQLYYNHFKLQHSDNCAVCKHCGMKFVSLYRLKRHLAKHNP